MITGSTYILRGRPVTVLAAWNGARPPADDRFPLIRTRPNAPRNVLIELPDGGRVVRPFRGLQRIGAAT